MTNSKHFECLFCCSDEVSTLERESVWEREKENGDGSERECAKYGRPDLFPVDPLTRFVRFN